MSLLKSTAKGMVWTSSSTIVRSLAGLFQITILTNYLAVEDFGTIAIAMVFLSFTHIFLDLGISAGIMHKQNVNKNQLSSLFWLNIFTGAILTIILLAIAPLISMGYNDSSLTPIIMLLSLTVFIASLGNQHRIIQQKLMRFKYMAIIEIIAAIVTMIVAVVLAVNNYGVYSLVYSTIVGVLLSNFLFLILGLKKDKNIYWHFKLKETYPFLKIGAFSIGSSVLDSFSREIDVIFIGAAFGKETLGFYTLCKKIVQMLYGIINPIITRILTPLFAQIQIDRNKVVNIYHKLIETLAITNLPIYFFVAIFSKTILYYLYGTQYIEASFILTVLAIYYGILSLSNPVGSLQIAFGRTDLGFYWTIYRITVTLIVVYIASFYTIEVLVLSFLFLGIINTIALWRFQIFIMLKMSFKKYFSGIIKPLCFILLLTVPFFYFFWKEVSLLNAILSAIFGLMFYIILVFKFIPNSYLVTIVKAEYLKLKKE